MVFRCYSDSVRWGASPESCVRLLMVGGSVLDIVKVNVLKLSLTLSFSPEQKYVKLFYFIL